MEEVKNKSIKLTAYVIDNDEIGKKYSSLYDNLVVKLSQNQDADARRMKLNLIHLSIPYASRSK